MKKKYYLLHVTHTYVTKNKLEEAVIDYIKTLDHLLFEAGRLLAFSNHFSACIELINNEHPRCKPIGFFWQAEDRTHGESNFRLFFHNNQIAVVRLSIAFLEPVTESF